MHLFTLCKILIFINVSSQFPLCGVINLHNDIQNSQKLSKNLLGILGFTRFTSTKMYSATLKNQLKTKSQEKSLVEHQNFKTCFTTLI